MFQIYLADYLPQNREELQRWLGDRSDFDWSETLRKIATSEGTDWSKIKQMEDDARAKVSQENLHTPLTHYFFVRSPESSTVIACRIMCLRLIESITRLGSWSQYLHSSIVAIHSMNTGMQ